MKQVGPISPASTTQPGVGRSCATRWALPLFAAMLLLGGCNKRTQLMLGVLTDLAAPGGLDTVTITAFREGVSVVNETRVVPGGAGRKYILPGSFGIFDPESGEPRIEIVLTGLQGGVERVSRRARLNLLRGRTIFYRMSLTQACTAAQAQACGPDQTCAEGKCIAVSVDSTTLLDYSEGDEESLSCDSGTQFISTETGLPVPLRPASGRGFCQEGTLYRIGTDDGGAIGAPSDGGVSDQGAPADLGTGDLSASTDGGAQPQFMWHLLVASLPTARQPVYAVALTPAATGSIEVFAVGDQGLALHGTSNLSSPTTLSRETVDVGGGPLPTLKSVVNIPGFGAWAGGKGELLQRVVPGQPTGIVTPAVTGTAPVWRSAVSGTPTNPVEIPLNTAVNSVFVTAPTVQPNAPDQAVLGFTYIAEQTPAMTVDVYALEVFKTPSPSTRMFGAVNNRFLTSQPGPIALVPFGDREVRVLGTSSTGPLVLGCSYPNGSQESLQPRGELQSGSLLAGVSTGTTGYLFLLHKDGVLGRLAPGSSIEEPLDLPMGTVPASPGQGFLAYNPDSDDLFLAVNDSAGVVKLLRISGAEASAMPAASALSLPPNFGKVLSVATTTLTLAGNAGRRPVVVLSDDGGTLWGLALPSGGAPASNGARCGVDGGINVHLGPVQGAGGYCFNDCTCAGALTCTGQPNGDAGVGGACCGARPESAMMGCLSDCDCPAGQTCEGPLGCQ
jgi:hypothetical protein